MELDIDEFFDVYRIFRPEATRAEYEDAWAEFQRAKADHEARKRMN